MKDLKGTKTEQNLKEAFAGESMARNKYSYFASKAKKDGFVQIANIFEETAANEKEHAKMWYKYLNGGSVSDTATNLADAAEAAQNPEEAEIRTEACLERAEKLLDSEQLPRNGYYAFVCEKCAPVFGHYGWFMTEAELLSRAQKIHQERTR